MSDFCDSVGQQSSTRSVLEASVGLELYLTEAAWYAIDAW